MTDQIPDVAIEAAAEAWFHIDESRYSGDADWPAWDSDENVAARQSYCDDARVAIEAAMPAIREHIAQEIADKVPTYTGTPIHDAHTEMHNLIVAIIQGGDQ